MPAPATERSRALVETALIVVGLAVLFAAAPHEVAGDDGVRFAHIEGLLHHGDLSGKGDGYSLIGPLFSLPFLALGEVIGSPTTWASHFNVFVVAIALLVLFVVTRGRVDRGFLRKFTLVLLFASLLTEGMRTYGPETITAALVGLGLLAVVGETRPVLGWAAIVVGVANVPASLGALALVVAIRMLTTKRLRPLLALAAAIALVMGEAWLRRGSPFTTGYEGNHGATTVMPYSGRPGFSYPFVLGLASILFSFGRGLIFFTSGLLLWLSARTRRLVPYRRTAILQLAFVAGLVLVYAKWWAWYGGLVWGPRYFIFAAIPASLFLASRLDRAAGAGETTAGRVFVLVLLAVSTWVGLTAALGDLHRLEFCAAQGYELEALCWYTPEYSGLWWPIGHYPLTPRYLVIGVYFVLVFAYLAAPLARAVARDLAPQRLRWAHGWRL
jgi:hypothetical protein